MKRKVIGESYFSSFEFDIVGGTGTYSTLFSFTVNLPALHQQQYDYMELSQFEMSCLVLDATLSEQNGVMAYLTGLPGVQKLTTLGDVTIPAAISAVDQEGLLLRQITSQGGCSLIDAVRVDQVFTCNFRLINNQIYTNTDNIILWVGISYRPVKLIDDV